MEIKELAAGEVLVHEGESGDTLYVILEGLIEISRSENARRSKRTYTVGPNAVIGELAVFTGNPRTASIMALSQATVAGLKGKDFNVLCDEFPDELLITLQWMQQRLLSYQLGECIDENDFWKYLNEDAKDGLAGLFCTMLIPAGQTLFNEGEQGHGLYLILSGRVQLTNQSDTPSNMGKHRNQTLAIFGKGDMLGEMALLTFTPRSGTARTLRDTQLAYLSRVAFEGILDKYPRQVLSASVHQIAERLRVRNRFGGQDFKLPAVITVLSRAKDCPLFTDELVAALSQLAPTKSVVKDTFLKTTRGHLSPLDLEERLLPWLNDQENLHSHMVLQAAPEDEAWAFRCFRQSDVVLIVADNDTDIPQLAEQLEKWKRMIGRTPMCHLVLLHHASVSLPTNTRKRLSGIKVERHWHVRMGSDDASRIARFLSGKSVGLVMGGGFALGLAHIGVAQALRDLKVPIDFVGGTSMGAIVAAACALNLSRQEMLEQLIKGCADSFKGDYTLPIVSILSGKKVAGALGAYFDGVDIEDMWIPYFAISASLIHTRMVVHKTGDALRATLASSRAPGVFPPLGWAGDVLVDGGLVNNVPSDVMRNEVGTGTVISVDVSPHENFHATEQFDLNLSGWKVLRSKLNQKLRRRESITIAGILSSMIHFGGVAHMDQIQAMADLHLVPPLQQFTLRDFDRANEMALIANEYGSSELARWIEQHGRPWDHQTF